VYIVFEHQTTLSDILTSRLSFDTRYLIFKKLLFNIVHLLQADTEFENIAILPQLIQVDNGMNPRYLFLPVLGNTMICDKDPRVIQDWSLTLCNNINFHELHSEQHLGIKRLFCSYDN
jgi:hypothetical protein